MNDFNCDTILSEFRNWRIDHSSISREDVFILFDCLLLSEPCLIKRKLHQFPSDLSEKVLINENKLKGIQKTFLLNLLNCDEHEVLESVRRLRCTLNIFKDLWDSGQIVCIADPTDVQKIISDDSSIMCLDLDRAYLISPNSIHVVQSDQFVQQNTDFVNLVPSDPC